ncbi:MAG: glycosyltransferase [Caldilineaceae bacterium]
MKVLFLIDTLEVGGAEHSLLDILARFKTVTPLIVHIYMGDTLKSTFEANGIPVVSLNLKGAYAFRQAIYSVVKLIRLHKPDLLHTTLFRANFVGRIAGRITGIPVTTSFVNESYAPVRLQKLSPTLRWKYKGTELVDRTTAGLTRHFIANSAAIKEANCKVLKVPPDKVSVIYRGRDPETFNKFESEKIDYIRQSLGLSDDEHVFLNVGRFVLQKGQIDLVRALSLVITEIPNCKMLFAGEGLYRSSLEDEVKKLQLTEVVMFLGLRNDIADLLQLCNLFIFPSYIEGHPGALVEAMFAACPIIASDIPVHRETIRDGHTGILVPSSDPAALTKAIIWMLQHPHEAQQMGKRAQADALQRFHIDQIVAQHESLYADLLQKVETQT